MLKKPKQDIKIKNLRSERNFIIYFPMYYSKLEEIKLKKIKNLK